MTDKNGIDSSIDIAGCNIWIYGREFPDCDEYWDANWLSVMVICKSTFSTIKKNGPFIRIDELANWNNEIKQLENELIGEAVLKTMEPEFSCSIKMERLGNAVFQVVFKNLVPREEHLIEYNIDQSYFSKILAQIENVLNKYQIIGST